MAVAASLLGCGYTLTGSGLEGVGAIAIQTPRNDSREPGVELLVADALRRELLRRDGAAITEYPERADLVVSGRVKHVVSRARAFSAAILAREHEIDLVLDLEATRRDGTSLALAGGTLREVERYFASADVEAERKNREEALRRLSSVLAGRFFDSLAVLPTEEEAAEAAASAQGAPAASAQGEPAAEATAP